jgi:hypothetical protein
MLPEKGDPASMASVPFSLTTTVARILGAEAH